MIPYIGDISKNDSIVLSELAAQSKNILEFGVGASTQVIAAFAKGKFTSIDTSIEWIDKTKKNLHLLEINLPINFCLYKDFLPSHDKYDFIFNDGLDSLRREFAMKIWNNLEVGGILAFHDTRRTGDIENVADIITQHSAEIQEVQINYNHSNITLIKKQVGVYYVDWNLVEKRESWQTGFGDIPETEIENIKKQIYR